ncbi:unnamed protein product [Allacma fusca]|uniref:Uncharacterized protein n=1 Tax=Allacma fusca TaxID=39272 RepID=A0A8J2JDL3_9HEXA|nr:unnamed protein product [Allacma fusca]
MKKNSRMLVILRGYFNHIAWKRCYKITTNKNNQCSWTLFSEAQREERKNIGFLNKVELQILSVAPMQNQHNVDQVNITKRRALSVKTSLLKELVKKRRIQGKIAHPVAGLCIKENKIYRPRSCLCFYYLRGKQVQMIRVIKLIQKNIFCTRIVSYAEPYAPT